MPVGKKPALFKSKTNDNHFHFIRMQRLVCAHPGLSNLKTEAMSTLTNNLIVAGTIVAAFGVYRFWPRKVKSTPLTELLNCKKSYYQIIQEIIDCKTVFRLGDIQKEADVFLDEYYEKTDSKTVRMMYRDLCLKIGYKKNKLT